MTRSYLIFLLFCASAVVMGQHDPQFSQNMFNQLASNPGFAGSSGMVNVSAINRQQWMGFEGAPKTTVFGADAAINLFGWDSGVGIVVMNDEIGFYNDLHLSVNYSYQVELAEGAIGFGVSLGLVNQVFDGTKIYLPSNGNGNSYHNIAKDALLPQAKVNGTAIDMGMGVFLERKNYYMGLSVLHLNKPKPNFKDEFQSYLKQTIFLTGGYRYKLQDKPIVLLPSVFIKSDLASMQADVNINVMVKNKYWGGLTYRYQDAIVVLAGMELNNGLRFGYSYDITTSEMATVSSGSHEFMVGYSFDMSFEKRNKKYRSVRYL